MRLLALRGENYRLLQEFDITFPDGVLGLVGRNGTGKSSLLEALMFACYGSDASRTTKEDLLNTHTTGDARVEFEFSLGQSHYRIERRVLRRNAAPQATIWRDGSQLATGAEAVSAEVTRLLGGRNELAVSHYVAQKQLDALTRYDPADRKRLILKLLGVEEIEHAIVALKEQRKEFDRTIAARQKLLPNITQIDADIVTLEQELASLVAQVAQLVTDIATAEAAQQAAEQAQAALDRDAETVAQHTTSLQLLDEQMATLADDELRLAERASQIKTARAELAQVEAHIDSLAADRPELDRLAEAYAVHRQLPELEAQRDALAVTLAELDGQIAASADAVNRAVELRRALRHATAAAEAAAVANSRANAQREQALAELNRCREELARLETQAADLDTRAETPDCPTCGQAIDDPATFRAHLAERSDELKQEERAIINRGREAKSAMSESEREQTRQRTLASRLEEQLAEAEAAGSDMRLLRTSRAERAAQAEAVASQLAIAAETDYDPERHIALSTAAERLPELTTRRTQLSTLLAGQASLDADRDRLQQTRASLEQRRAEATASIAAAGYAPDQHSAVREAAAVAREATTTARLEHSARQGEQRLVAERLQRVRADRDTHARLTAEIDRILSDRGDLELTRELMETFKVQLIGRIRPALARVASGLLRELSEGRYSEFALDADYDISIGEAGALRPVRGISGGEADLANLCLRLAISRLINEARGVGATFIVLDEVLGSQDSERREAIVDVLPRLAGHFAQIIMVTHEPAVQDRFPNLLRVQFDHAAGISSAFFPPRTETIAA